MENQNIIKPFLRWAGGKNWLIKYIDQYLPSKIINYHEPFIGGGSVFFYLKSKALIKGKSFLSDSNEELISTYSVVKESVSDLINRLRPFKNDKDYYYEIRNSKPRSIISKAAKFIYLNRTSFNGIYRVNQKGQYNVPYGNKEYATLFEYENLKNCSNILGDSILSTNDFSKSLSNIKQNDLVFIDPPYTVAHGNNGFIKYNQKIFAWEDQIRLKNYINEITNIGAYFILTNAHHDSVFQLFRELGEIHIVERSSVVGGKNAPRKFVKEYIFTNIK